MPQSVKRSRGRLRPERSARARRRSYVRAARASGSARAISRAMSRNRPGSTSRTSASTRARTVTLKGWLYNQRSSGKLHFLQVRDGTGFIQCVMFKKDVPPEQFALADHLPQESSLDRHRHGARRRARAARLRARRHATCESCSEAARLPDHAEGARRRLPARPPPPLAALGAPARDPARPQRGHPRLPRLLRRHAASRCSTRRSSRRPRARARRRCSRPTTSTSRRT